MVEQTDSEALDTYEAGDLFGDAAFTRFRDARLEEYFSPPTLTKTWFHQGAVGEEYGDWEELDYTAEYWPVDPGLLDHVADVNAFLATYNDRPGTIPSPRNRRIKRDALRALRGRVLRTELYARDASARERSAYTVTEFAYGLAEVDAPDQGAEVRGRVFFSHEVARRTTQWERGNDPLTVFALSDDYDAFGQPTRQTSVAVPRRVDQRGSFSAAVIGTAQPDQTATLATHTYTRYATPPAGRYIHSRVAEIKTFELTAPPSAPDAPGDGLQTLLRKQWAAAKAVRDLFKSAPSGALRLLAHAASL
jgi:hypothetical protein